MGWVEVRRYQDFKNPGSQADGGFLGIKEPFKGEILLHCLDFGFGERPVLHQVPVSVPILAACFLIPLDSPRETKSL